MIAGAWLDLVLLLLLGLTFVALYRLTPATPGGAAGFDANDSSAGTGSSRRARLRSHAQRLTRQAGFDPDHIRGPYWATKMILAAVVPLMISALASPHDYSWLGLGLPALIAFVLPDLVLLLLRRRRRRRVRASLSYFLDLLVALVRAGSPLETAFARAGASLHQGRGHPLADEVALIAQELSLGKDRTAAFDALAVRTGVHEVKALAAALGMGLRLGASVESILTSQAEILRAKQREHALKLINRAAAQAIIPTMLCGFPVLLLLILFPAGLEIMEAFQALKTVLQ